MRDRARAADLVALGAELIDGDATDGAAVLRGIAGVDVAFHLAGIYEIGVVDRAALERVNVHGARVFLGALDASGVKRGVFVSTTAAFGPSEGGRVDIDARYTGPYPSTYHRTKTEAHWLAREAQRRGAPLVIVSPAFVYGPGDAGPPGRLIRDLLKHRVPGLLSEPASFSFVHVDDVAAAIAAAGELERTSRVYAIGGEVCTINDFAEQVCALLGRRAPRLRFPVPLARVTGHVLDAVTRLSGARFTISAESIRVTARTSWCHDDPQAAAELGHAPRPLAEGLPPTVEWFMRQAESA